MVIAETPTPTTLITWKKTSVITRSPRVIFTFRR